MAEYTLIKIDQLPDGTANLSSKVMFGIDDKIYTTTIEQMLSLFTENNSITPRQQFVNLLVTSSNFATILNGVNLTIAQNEIVFLQINALFNNRLTLNTYLVPLGAGVYNPLGSFVPFASLILINEQPYEEGSETNTITYTVTGLDEINEAVIPFDFSDETKVYFVTFGGILYRFIGVAGLYGDGELQMELTDLEQISTAGNGDFVQKIFASFDKWVTDEITLSLDGKTNFIATTALASFKGFNFPSPNDNFYEGKPFILFNDSGSDIEIVEDSADVDLPFLNGYTHENGKLILFVPVLGKLHMVGSIDSGGGTWGSITGTLSDQTDLQAALDARQKNAIYITENTTAVNNDSYIANGTFTITDVASPATGSNFEVFVRGGSVTIDGTVYTTGVFLRRIYNGTTWINGVSIQLDPNSPNLISLISLLTATQFNALTLNAQTLYAVEEKSISNFQSLEVDAQTFTINNTNSDIVISAGNLTGDSEVNLINEATGGMLGVNLKDYNIVKISGIATLNTAGSQKYFQVKLKSNSTILEAGAPFFLLKGNGVADPFSFMFMTDITADILTNELFFNIETNDDTTFTNVKITNVRVHKNLAIIE
jgi:hypothetical protein